MPKQLYKIVQFHGGLNSNSDARDIAENELSEATDVMVDELGKIRLMGGTTAHVSVTPEDDQSTGWTGTLISGYGLFYFSHDRTGAENRSNFSGEHDAGDHATIMTDSGEAFVTDALIGGIIYNDTDGSSGVITDNDGTTVTVGALAGGSDNSWDTSGDDDYHISMPVSGDDYLAIYDGNDGQVWIYSRVRDAWDDVYGTSATNTGVIDIGSSSTTTAEVSYYNVDGVLRVSDGNHANSNTNQWYGYIARTHFPGLTPGGTADIYNGWFAKDQEIAAPTTGLASVFNEGLLGSTTAGDTTTLTHSGAFANFTDAQIDGKGYIAHNTDDNSAAVIEERDSDNSLGTASTDDWYPGVGRAYNIHPAAGTGWNMVFTEVGSGGNWIAEDYEVATTFIYDGNQESLPFETGGGFTLSSNGYVTATVMVTSPYNPRITGGRTYYRIADSDDDWKLLFDIDLYKGCQGSGEGGWHAWSLSDSDVDAVSILMDNNTNARMVTQDLVNTYEVLNEYSGVASLPSFTNSLVASYKTSVVANRITYIGNIKTKNKDNEDEVMGDAIIKSPVNKFDTFPLNRILETSIRDGDEIIKLETYADRLLIFKKNKLELLNISQELEFLEDTFMHKGVSHSAATCKTDFGIAWVNEKGCYLYDGQKVNNLLEKGGRQIIKESEWSDFVDEPMIGYIAKKRQIIVVDDITTTGDGASYLYDLVTQSWVKGAAATFDDQNKTNFTTDWNGDLVYAHTAGNVVKWDDAADTSSAMVMTTKDIDFGNPGQLKNIYKVYLTYRGVGTHVQLHYGVDGLAPALTFNSITSGTDGSSTGSGTAAKSIPYDAGVTDWLKAELKPSAAISNVNSFRLKISGDGSNAIAADFEINDVSIVYRLKGIR